MFKPSSLKNSNWLAVGYHHGRYLYVMQSTIIFIGPTLNLNSSITVLHERVFLKCRCTYPIIRLYYLPGESTRLRMVSYGYIGPTHATYVSVKRYFIMRVQLLYRKHAILDDSSEYHHNIIMTRAPCTSFNSQISLWYLENRHRIINTLMR